MTTQLQHALVRVHKHDGEPVGAGLLVADRLVLTCAHVINQALGVADDNQAQPSEAVRLDFPFLPSEPYVARVVRWIPVAQDGRGGIAGLALSAAPPPVADTIQLVAQAELWDTDFRVLGFPAGYDNGVYSHGRIRGQLAHEYVQLETEGEFKTLPGFSGSPVWSEQANGVVGIVVAADRNPKIKVGFMIPTTALAAAWDILRPHEQLPVPKADFLPTVGGAVAPTLPFSHAKPMHKPRG
jgi:V8-like Glu-specific endopeptidase